MSNFIKELRTYFCIIAFGSTLIFAAGNTNAQDLDCASASALVAVFEENHVDPKACNDSFSVQLYEHFLSSLDPNSNYFTDVEINQLEKYRNELDDQIKENSCDFVNETAKLYEEQLKFVRNFIEEQLKKPYDFTKDEQLGYSYSGKKFGFIDNHEKQKSWWRKRMKLQVLELVAQSNGEGDQVQIEKEAREKVRMKLLRRIDKLLKPNAGLNTYVHELFLSSIASLYDPHSSYFSIQENDDFESQLSKQVLSFGIEYEMDDADHILVDRLVPGGPAWKSNQIHKGDILEKITYQDGETVDIYGYSGYEIQELLSVDKAFTTIFHFRKPGGIVKEVRLKKEKLRADENIIKSFLLKGKENVGYISLPGFYTEWGAGANRGCAEDLARELTKLQLENINGLVLDLRYNGGGSLEEAIELAGIFIEEGVLFQVYDREPILVKDPNRGSIYDGPLIILINEASASASEILSNALQDYNRAIIVGSTSYGKATGQNIMPVDEKMNIIMPSFNTIELPKVSGYVKVTTSKLYGVHGNSYQKKGITPDIELPSLISGLVPTEESEPFALTNDPITKAKYFTPLPEIKMESLVETSKTRVEANNEFNNITICNDSLKARYNQSSGSVSLNLVSFLKEDAQEAEFDAKLDELGKKNTELYKVTNHRYDQELLDLDSYGSENNKILIDQITSDVYVEEAYRIILDVLQLE